MTIDQPGSGPDCEPGTPAETPGTPAETPGASAEVPGPSDGSGVASAASPRRGPSRRTRLGMLVAAAALAILGTGLIGWALTHQQQIPAPPAAAVTGSAQPAGPATTPIRPAEVASPPARIRIASIGVDSPVESVGLNPDRTMQVPAPGPAYDRAAWYRYSVTPGRQGPSVIIGHVDSRAAGPSVFYDLGRVRPGQRVDVTRADRVTISFLVTDVASVPKDAFPTDLVYRGTPGPELRLITCGGPFDSDVRSYRNNTVVFAREVGRRAT